MRTDCVFCQCACKDNVFLDFEIDGSSQGANNCASTSFVAVHVFNVASRFQIETSCVEGNTFANNGHVDVMLSRNVAGVLDHHETRCINCSLANFSEHVHLLFFHLQLIQGGKLANILVIINHFFYFLRYPLGCSNRPSRICKVTRNPRAPRTCPLEIGFLRMHHLSILCRYAIIVNLLLELLDSLIEVRLILVFLLCFLVWLCFHGELVVAQNEAVFEDVQHLLLFDFGGGQELDIGGLLRLKESCGLGSQGSVAFADVVGFAILLILIPLNDE